MEKIKIREDNKKVYKLAYIILGIYAFVIAYVNIMNTQNIVLLYSLLISTVVFLLSLIVLLVFKRKRHTVEVSYNTNQLLFYQSTYEKNKQLKLLIVIFDILSLISLIGLTTYFFFKMDFVRAYDYYGLIALGAISLALIAVLIKDIINLSKIDRCEINHSLFINSYDKKLLLGLIMIIIGIFNIGILSFEVPHFKVLWIDILVFELLGLLTTIIYILCLYFSSKYYSHYTFKKIDDILIDTEILECIGKGQFASIYKVYVPSLDKIFAVKKLEATRPVDISRFEDEFKLMKSVNHPNLLQVYSYNELKLEYIMDYCDFNIYDYINTHAISKEERLSLINQLIEGMEYLHKHGILHRDLSLGNVMIKQINDNEIKLVITDFGLAKSEINLTKTKTEQGERSSLVDMAITKLSQYTAQSDIYGIGYIMNFIYTGQVAITQDDYMSKICARCMDINLNNRYHSINEIKEELSKGETL